MIDHTLGATLPLWASDTMIVGLTGASSPQAGGGGGGGGRGTGGTDPLKVGSLSPIRPLGVPAMGSSAEQVRPDVLGVYGACVGRVLDVYGACL